MKELYTEIEINASAERVWKILTDLQNYDKWNPFITSAKGDLKEGGELRVNIKPHNAKEQSYTLKILRLEKEKEFRWLGKMFVKGILNGDHIFELHSIDEKRIKFVQREYFTGLLVPFVWGSFLNTKLRKAFENLNKCLKVESEQIDRN